MSICITNNNCFIDMCHGYPGYLAACNLHLKISKEVKITFLHFFFLMIFQFEFYANHGQPSFSTDMLDNRNLHFSTVTVQTHSSSKSSH